jgi:hypothetical protein
VSRSGLPRRHPFLGSETEERDKRQKNRARDLKELSFKRRGPREFGCVLKIAEDGDRLFAFDVTRDSPLSCRVFSIYRLRTKARYLLFFAPDSYDAASKKNENTKARILNRSCDLYDRSSSKPRFSFMDESQKSRKAESPKSRM